MADRYDNILVVGGGIAGIQASLNLAQSGVKVYLLEKNSHLGGTLAQLDKWYETNSCGMCRVLPTFGCDEASEFCLRRGLRHPNIEVITNANIESLRGLAGEFIATVRRKANYIAQERCIGCGLCVGVCPIEVQDEFEKVTTTRKAIYAKSKLATPASYRIDIDNCSRCGECIEVCPTGAIDLSAEDTIGKLNVGSIILAGGSKDFDPTALSQYGYGRCSNIVTSTELERILSPTGSHKGNFVRPSDGKEPTNIAFLQCIGSRDVERNYCSATCCMFALKEAAIIKERNPNIDVQVFFMDMRAYGKGHYRYYEKVMNKGVKFVRCRIPAIEEDSETKNLRLSYETEDGKLVKDEFSMFVLSVGQAAPKDAEKLSQIFGIKLNQYGFCETDGVTTNKEGIYVCGAFSGPKDIEETITQANSAAIKAYGSISSQRQVVKKGFPEEMNLVDQEPTVGIFICLCGREIAHALAMDELMDFSKKLPGVSLVEPIEYLCFHEHLERVKEEAKEHRVNRVIFAACTYHSFGALFKKTVREFGLNPSLLEVVNLREQLAWVHGDKVEATKKATGLIAMAHKKVRLQEPLHVDAYPVAQRALVIGGGMVGLTCALSIAEQGVKVDLVEKCPELGGNLKKTYYTLEGIDTQRLLKDLMDQAESEKLIKIYKGAEIAEVTGHVGNFKTTFVSFNPLDGGEKTTVHKYGTIIVATGAKEYEPTEYLFGQDPRIITQRQLEERLVTGNWRVAKTLVMIQCVGSREKAHPYCSRICCSQAIKNALKLRERDEKANIYILYRDIMTYGFKEQYYTKAREKGVVFIRYDVDEKPEVRVDNGNLAVEVRERILDEKITMRPDFLVLSTGIVPNDNKGLAERLNIPLAEDGFFQEADTRFRPLSFNKSGIFFCGLAHSPRSLTESVTQAHAAAANAVSLLKGKKLDAKRTRAYVNERLCLGCALCVQACPFDAREMDEETKTAKVIDIICQGCGTCAVACPSGATQIKNFRQIQILDMVDAVC